MKFSITDLEQAIYHLPKGSELGTLVIVEEENDARKPWEAKKPESKLQKSDFSSSIEIISANMLHIPKTVLSPRALSRISRLAAFDNPEFYRKQRLRVSTRDTPRVISTHQESDEYISIPRGTKPALTALLEASKASFSLIDMTNHGVPLEVSFTGKLHDEQLLAADALLEHDIGVLSAAPGFGKTVVAASIIANRKVNTLVLLRNQQVLRQWKQTLASYLSFFNKLPFGQANSKRTKGTRSIGEYSSYKKELTGIVDIAMVQSLIKHGEVDDIVKNYGMVIVDEVHQVPAVTFAAVLQHVNAKYVYGLTATPSRKDGRTPIIGFEFGPIRYRTDDREQAKKRPFEHYMIPKFTSFQRTSAHDEQNYSTLLSDLVSNSDRNQMIVDDVISAINMGRNPLVLSDRIDHVIALSDLLRDSCENVITLIGKLSIAERREAIERLSELKADDRFVIVATAKLVGEGFDYPRLDTLFLTVPISWKGRIAQYVGRLHRIYEGKQDVYVYDYVDASIPVLENMYYKRLRSYKSIGYSALVDNGAGSTNSSSVLFGKDEYWAFFKNDCEQSKKEIVISSPKLVLHQVARVLTSLSPALLNDLVITILTLPIDELSASARSAAKQCMDRMRELNIKVFETPGLFQKMAVFDQQIVWYGSMSLLGNAMSTDNLLRLDDPIIAKTLLKMINTQ
ncbi:MAG: DEAD/DEAH box helicase family protein [Coriobacteriales bacterium]|nr:DEAD/DEAH box helicase family protein [Coriobacteriales bacterium]